MSTKAQQVQEGEIAPSENDVPEGWATAPLGDLAKVEWGNTSITKKSYTEKGFPAFSASGKDGLLPSAEWHGPAVVLSAIGARCGKCFFADGDWTAIKNTIVIQAGEKSVENRYLFFYLNDDHRWSISGSGQPFITMGTAQVVPVPVAPREEQNRIVEQIEKLIPRTNASRAHLAKCSVILKAFRQAVLASACSGKLTEDWRSKNSTSESSDVLLYRILESRKELLAGRSREPKTPSGPTEDYPETWTPATLDQLTWLITSGSRGWARYYSDSGASFIRAENINSDWLNTSDIAHVRIPAAAEGSRTKVQLNDLLITITGANVTKSAVVDQELENAYVSQHVALVRPVEANSSRFLYLCIVSPSHGRKKLLDDAYGAGKPGLNLDNIREMVVALPPVEEQQEIVRRVEALFKLADAIEKRVAAASLRAERLTQAILAKAFRGELVPTEAELARREGRQYEPAGVLLERIKAERKARRRNSSGAGRR